MNNNTSTLCSPCLLEYSGFFITEQPDFIGKPLRDGPVPMFGLYLHLTDKEYSSNFLSL